MKSSILIFLFCSFFTSFSQGQKLWIGLNGSISDKSFEYDKMIYEDELKSSLSYRLAIQSQYFLTEKFFVNTGLGIELNNYEIPSLLRPSDDSDYYVPLKTNTKILYLSIPITTGYKISLSEKLSFMPNIGVNIDFLLASSEKTTFGDGHEQETNIILTDLTNTVYSVAFDFPVDYALNPKIRTFIAPNITKGLNKIDNTKALNTTFSYGVKLGLIVGI